MDIAQLVAARQDRVYAIRDHIEAEQVRMDAEQEVLEELQRLSSQSSFTIAEINYLIEHSND